MWYYVTIRQVSLIDRLIPIIYKCCMVAYCMHGTCADALNTYIHVHTYIQCTTYSVAQVHLWNNDNLMAGYICASCWFAQERQNRLVFPRGRFVEFHIGKLCEQVIVNKLKSSVQTAISSSQCAYRPKLDTTDAIIQLIDECTADLDD